MAISFVAAGAVGSGTNPIAAVPAGIQKNDLLLIVTSGSATPTTPAGWTQLNAQGAAQFLTVLFKFATASETNVTLTQTGTSSRAVMLAYRGAGGVEVRPAFATGTGTTVTPNTLTTTYANDYVISLYACAIEATTWTANGSTTSRVNSAPTAALTGLLIADELQVAAGVSTARAATLAASRAFSALAIALIEDNRTLYWTGGNGTWDATTTTSWSNTSGGAGGAVAPSLMDNCIVDASSGSPTITLFGVPVCKSLTTTGATCTFSSTGTLQLNGDMILSATTTWSATGRITVIGTGTITTNGVSLASPLTVTAPGQTVSLGSNLTTTGAASSFFLESGTLNLDTRVLTATSFAITGTASRSITFGGGSSIDITGTTGTVWNGATATNFTTTGTPTINLRGAGSIVHGTLAGTENNSRLDFNQIAGTGVSFTSDTKIRSLNFETGTFNVPSPLALYGSFRIVSPAVMSGGTGNSINFRATTTGNTVIATVPINGSFNFIGDSSTGEWTFGSDLQFNNSNLILSSGIVSTNNYNISTALAITTASSGGSNKVLNLGSSTITLTRNSGTCWNFAVNTNVTVNAGTSQINVSTGGATQIFSGGGFTYNNINVANQSLLRIDGSNTFNKISNSPTTGPGTELSFISGTTTTVGQFDVRGTAGNIVTVSSASGIVTLASLGDAVQSNIDYVAFNNIIATPTPTATGTVPYYWYIGSNSTKNTTTTGVVLSSDTSYTYYNLLSGTSWSVPANWNSSVNDVYLLGGGGGGSGSVVASSTGNHVSGAGGGGGGFTALSNVTLTAGGTVSYAIGAAGAAGSGSTSASTAGNGGTTTFNISNTAGGGGGGAGTTTTSTAGAAGVGSTQNGGAGGIGNAVGNVTNAGSGGGGSGGIDAAGQAGATGAGATRGAGGVGNGVGNTDFLVGTITYGDGGLGGTTTGAGVVGVIYGGAGGGGGTTASSATTRAGGLGTQGIIVLRYQTVAPPSTASGNFLNFFYQ